MSTVSKSLLTAADAMMRTIGPLVRGHRLWEPGETLAIGLSGGKDSLTLTWLLLQASRFRLPACRVVALHVPPPPHCPCAVSVSELKTAVATLPDLPLHLLETAEPLPSACDRCARERRHRLFHACRDMGIRTLVLAHHQDDLVQTLLMNILFHGEVGATMRPVRHFGAGTIRLIRPLLTTPEKRLITLARRLGYLHGSHATAGSATEGDAEGPPTRFGPESSQRTAVRVFLHGLGRRRDTVKANLARLACQAWKTTPDQAEPGS